MNHRARLVGAVLLVACSAPAGADLIYLLSPARIDQDATIDPSILKECAIDERVSRQVSEMLDDKFLVVATETTERAGKSRLLTLSILKIIGRSGGVWTGKKGIVLRGQLSEDGQTVGSFTAQRRSSGGAWGLFNDACYILDRCAVALGKDIARWLERPGMDSWLGEMSGE